MKCEIKHERLFTDYLLRKGFSNSSIGRYVRDVGCFIKWLKGQKIEEDQVGYGDVLSYIQERKGQVKQITISAELNTLRQYYDSLEKEELIGENPTNQIKIRGIKRRNLYDILSKEGLERLYEGFGKGEFRTSKTGFTLNESVRQRDKVLLGLLIYQGLGTAELGALRLGDLKLREGIIKVAGSRKSNGRELKLESHQVLDLMEYQLKTRSDLLSLSGKETDQLLVSSGKSTRFSSLTQKLIKKLQVQDVQVSSIKQIRTSVITQWLKVHNLRQVQYMAGHRYVSSTEAYLINDIEDLQDDIMKYHPIG